MTLEKEIINKINLIKTRLDRFEKLELSEVSTPDHHDIRSDVNTSDTTPNPDCDDYDMYVLTALSGNATVQAMSGTPVEGHKFLFRIEDNGTSRDLSWNSVYRACGVDLPTATTAGKIMYVGFVYNNTDSKWDCVAFTEEE